MKNFHDRSLLFLLLLVFAFVACQKPDQIKKVSFTLHVFGKPAPAGMDVAIFPVEKDAVVITEANRLGAGKTDENGRITVEFTSPAKYSEYVPLCFYSGGASGMAPALGGKPFTFRCDKSPCDLGDVTGESFIFGGGKMGVR